MEHDELNLLHMAMQAVLSRYYGRYNGTVHSDGTVRWFSGPESNAPGSFVKGEDIAVLNSLLQSHIRRLRSQNPRQEAPSIQSAAPQPDQGSSYSLPAFRRTVSENNAVRYLPVNENYEGDRYYRRVTPSGSRQYLNQEQYDEYLANRTGGAGGEGQSEDETGASPKGRWDWMRRPVGGAIIGDMMKGSVYGGMATAVTGGLVGAMTNPIHEMLSVALESGGGTGAGVMRVANGVVSLFSHGIQAAAQVGGTLIGASLGLLLGGALGGLVATVAGALAGLFGAALGQVGRTAGELIGGISSVFRDATKAAMEYADAMMHVGAVSGMSLQSANSFLTTMQLAGISPGSAQGMLQGIGGRQEFRGARFGAWGVGMGGTEAETMMNVSQRMQSMPGYMQPIMAQSLYGSQGSQLLPMLQDPSEIMKIMQAEQQLMPVTENLHRLWKDLNIPLRETGLLWLNLKTEFISGFAPLISSGIERMTQMWGTHKEQIIKFFADLPGIMLDYAAKAADWLYRAFYDTMPKLEQFWNWLSEKFKSFMTSAEKVFSWIKDNPTLTALIGGTILGGPAGGIGAAAGANIGGAVGGPGGAMLGGALGMRAVEGLGGIGNIGATLGGLRSVVGWLRNLGPVVNGLSRLSSVAGWFRELGAAISGLSVVSRAAGWFRALGVGITALSGGLPSLIALLGPGGLILGIIGAAVGLAGWGAGFWGADKQRKQAQASEKAQKGDAEDRGYFTKTQEDIAEELYGEKDLDKLSESQRATVNSRWKAARAGASAPSRSIRAENDPNYAASQMVTPWGDFFRNMKDELGEFTEKPLKVEGNVTVQNQVSINPNPDFEMALEAYETEQSWRVIQSAVGG